MHTLIVVGKSDYRINMEKLVKDAANRYDKACYMSFGDPYHIIIQLLDNAKVHHDRFIIIDASGTDNDTKVVSESTYIIPVKDLFKTYLFLRNIIQEQSIQMLLLDSLSALIDKHNELPLKHMLTNLLLEVGSFRCNSSIVVFDEHAQHEVVSHLGPFIAKTVFLR